MSAVNVRAVTQEAGVSIGMVHYCFANKDELLIAMADTICHTWGESVSQIVAELAATSGTATELGAQFSQSMLAMLRAGRSQRNLLAELIPAIANQDDAARVSSRHHELVTDVSKQLILAVAGDSGRSADTLSGYVVDPAVVRAFFDGAELAWHLEGDDAAALAAYRGLIEVLMMTRCSEPRCASSLLSAGV